jgi:beta-glucuronidase
MLRPQDNGVRETRRLDGLWEFCVDRGGAGRAEQWWRHALPQSVPIAVPASYNELYADPEIHDHVGDVWYQRSVFAPRGWDGQRIVLRFDAATHRAVVWVDDVAVLEHEGGYTPFEADISAHLQPGVEHRLTVVVNNELSWQSIPPGIVEVRPDGTKKQRYYHDFFNFAGLHRSVWLYSTPRHRIADLTVQTDIEGSVGVVHCSTETEGSASSTEGDGGAELRLRLRDAAGAVVAEAADAQAELRVADANLWRPGAGYLYDLEVELVTAGNVVDSYTQPVGIRTVRVDGTRFLINDEPFYFRGFGMHEDLNVHGKGHDPAAMVHDFALLGWIGANSFRTSHYPYAEEVLDHADRLGVVVIDETAAVGLNLAVGGGMFLGGVRQTFTEDTIGTATQQVHRQAIEELIARDKNHPCVVLWSVANEPESNTEESLDYFTPLFAAARDADPTRPVGFVNMMLAMPDACLVTELADVVMVNRYYGWYVEPGDLKFAELGLEKELRAWADKHGKPIIITEYGADAMPGVRSVENVVWSEEYQAALLDVYHEVFDRIDAVVGEQVWNFADFATAQNFVRVDGNKKGVFTRDRRPKVAAYHLRRRWRGQ